MSDIGIIGIVSSSGTSGTIEFETKLNEIIIPINSQIKVGIISNRKSVTYSIEQDTASTIVNVPAFTFENYGTNDSNNNYTVLVDFSRKKNYREKDKAVFKGLRFVFIYQLNM